MYNGHFILSNDTLCGGRYSQNGAFQEIYLIDNGNSLTITQHLCTETICASNCAHIIVPADEIRKGHRNGQHASIHLDE